MFTKLVMSAAIVATNLLSSTTTYQADYQPIVLVVKEEVVEIELDKTLEAIIACESKGNPMAINKNKNGTTDYGILQVNSVHKQRMGEMGLNIENPDHSFAFGLILYEESGTKHWYSSKHCWLPMVE